MFVRGEGLSKADQRLVKEMERLAWKAVQAADPDWAAEHLKKFRGIRIAVDSPFLTEEAALRQSFTARYETLQAKQKVPDFFTLRERARRNLGRRPLLNFRTI